MSNLLKIISNPDYFKILQERGLWPLKLSIPDDIDWSKVFDKMREI